MLLRHYLLEYLMNLDLLCLICSCANKICFEVLIWRSESLGYYHREQVHQIITLIGENIMVISTSLVGKECDAVSFW